MSVHASRPGWSGSLLRAFLASAAAVAAVVLGIVAANLVQRVTGGSSGGQGPVVAAATTSPASARPVPSGSGRLPTPGAAQTAAPRTSAAPTSSTAPSSPAATSSAAATPADSRPTVTVLNVSGINGQAGKAASQMQAKGWTVADTGDARSSMSTTTCYYDGSAQQAACAQLMKDVPGVGASAPRPSAVVKRDGIVVLVTKTFA